MELNALLSDGIAFIARNATRFYAKSPSGLAFMARASKNIMKANATRSRIEAQEGVHVPAFLIASVATQCNLRCTGCYAFSNGICSSSDKMELSAQEWDSIFEEAANLGVSFSLVAGGEPLLRKDVLECLANQKKMIFPVFTNGTLMDDDYLRFFKENLNMIPVFSVEGTGADTDKRRGAGVAEMVEQAMNKVQEAGIMFGASITVSTENFETATDPAFVDSLRDKGCGLVFFVEYAPIDPETAHLALDFNGQIQLAERVKAMAEDPKNSGIILLAFPGSEAEMGGCLAAGRGFFHIAPDGAAEPCPFSPYSVANVRDDGLMGALKSPFFEKIRKIEESEDPSLHMGGCTLLRHEAEVYEAQKASLAETTA